MDKFKIHVYPRTHLHSHGQLLTIACKSVIKTLHTSDPQQVSCTWTAILEILRLLIIRSRKKQRKLKTRKLKAQKLKT